MRKPFAESCEENKQVILEQLRLLFEQSECCLEIGSGTGQHAVHFSKHLPDIKWQPTELAENIDGINLWLHEAALDNVLPPVTLNVAEQNWRLPSSYDAAFTANTLHIMSFDHVEKLFSGLAKVLRANALFVSYGPFNYNGQYSSESNARFDQWLRQRDPLSGIRDIDELKKLASQQSIELIDDIEMPVNNRLLVWRNIS